MSAMIAIQENDESSFDKKPTGSKAVKPASAVAVEKHENGRVRVSRACSECKKAHTRCNFGRPCSRCLKLGLNCVDIPSATKRGRGSLTAMENYKKNKELQGGQPAAKKRRFCPKTNVEFNTIQQLLTTPQQQPQQTTSSLPAPSNNKNAQTTTTQTNGIPSVVPDPQQNFNLNPPELQMFSLPTFAQTAYSDLLNAGGLLPQNATALLELSNRLNGNSSSANLQNFNKQLSPTDQLLLQQQLQQQIQQQPIRFDPNDTSFLSLLGINTQNLSAVERLITLAQQPSFPLPAATSLPNQQQFVFSAPNGQPIQIDASELHYDPEKKFTEADIEDFFENNQCSNKSCEFYDDQNSRCAISGAPNAAEVVKKNLYEHGKIMQEDEDLAEDMLADGNEDSDATEENGTGDDSLDDFAVPQASETSSPALSVENHNHANHSHLPQQQQHLAEVKVEHSGLNSPININEYSPQRTYTIQKKCRKNNGSETLINTLVEEKILYEFIDGLQNSLKTNFSPDKKEEIKLQIAHLIDSLELKDPSDI